MRKARLAAKAVVFFFIPPSNMRCAGFINALASNGAYEEALYVSLVISRKIIAGLASHRATNNIIRKVECLNQLNKNKSFYETKAKRLASSERILLSALLCVPKEYDDSIALEGSSYLIDSYIRDYNKVLIRMNKPIDEVAVLLTRRIDVRLLKLISEKANNLHIIASYKVINKYDASEISKISANCVITDNIYPKNSRVDFKIASSLLNFTNSIIKEFMSELSICRENYNSVVKFEQSVHSEIHTRLYSIIYQSSVFKKALKEISVSEYLLFENQAVDDFLGRMLHKKADESRLKDLTDEIELSYSKLVLFLERMKVGGGRTPTYQTRYKNDKTKKTWFVVTFSNKDNFRTRDFLPYFYTELSISKDIVKIGARELLEEVRAELSELPSEDQVTAAFPLASNLQKTYGLLLFISTLTMALGVNKKINEIFANHNDTEALIYVGSDRLLTHRAIQVACTSHQIPTFLYTYLFLSKHPLYYKPVADYVLTPDSEYQKSLTEIFGEGGLEMINVGSHMISRRMEKKHVNCSKQTRNKLLEGFPIPLGKKIILIATQPGMLNITLMLLEYISRSKQGILNKAVCVIRPHPGALEDMRLYEAWIEKEKLKDKVFVDFNHDLTDWLISSDLVITYFSNVGTEAALLGAPVLVVKEKDTEYPVDLEKIGVAVAEEIGPSLDIAVDSILEKTTHYQRWKSLRREFVNRNSQFVSPVEKNIIDAVEHVAEKITSLPKDF